MNNRKILIQSTGRDAFDLAFKLIFDSCPGGKATHYFEHPKSGFLLLWHEDSFNINNNKIMANKLPYPMTYKESADLVWGWLINQPDEKYEDYLDHDGDNEKGFKVYNEDWAYVADSHYAFAGIKPVWAWYGK